MPQLRNFLSNCSGTIAIVFAFVFPVMVMFVGGMVDVGMAIAARSELAYVTKVACTRLATAASNGMSTSDQLRVANAAVAAKNFPGATAMRIGLRGCEGPEE